MKTSLQQRIILIALISTGFGLTSVFSGRSVFAQETHSSSVRRVSVPVATGQSAVSPVLIELSPGYGVNISFIPTGEAVEKVWFDNPSFATLDVDGCLSGLGRECQQNAATVLHLRRINSLNMPGLAKTNSTLLTVVTAGESGRRVYVFRVAMGNKNSQYHTVEVTPKETPKVIANNPPRLTSVLTQYQDSQMMSRGLIVAQQQRLIRRDSPLWKRIENFLVSVKAGEPIEVAAAKSGISLQLVQRLQELGKTSPVQPPVQAS